MDLPMLRSLLMVRASLFLAGKCCRDYEIPDKVVRQIGTKDAYQSQENELENTVDISSDEENVFNH